MITEFLFTLLCQNKWPVSNDTKVAKEFLEPVDKLLVEEIVWPKHVYKTNGISQFQKQIPTMILFYQEAKYIKHYGAFKDKSLARRKSLANTN